MKMIWLKRYIIWENKSNKNSWVGTRKRNIDFEHFYFINAVFIRPTRYIKNIKMNF